MPEKSKILSFYIAVVSTAILVVLCLIYTKLPQQYTAKDVAENKAKIENLPATTVVSGYVNVSGEVDIGSVRDVVDVSSKGSN